jgi:hypothetical protein
MLDELYFACIINQYSVQLQTGQQGFNPRQRQRAFLVALVSKSTQPSIQWVPGLLSQV